MPSRVETWGNIRRPSLHLSAKEITRPTYSHIYIQVALSGIFEMIYVCTPEEIQSKAFEVPGRKEDNNLATMAEWNSLKKNRLMVNYFSQFYRKAHQTILALNKAKLVGTLLQETIMLLIGFCFWHKRFTHSYCYNISIMRIKGVYFGACILKNWHVCIEILCCQCFAIVNCRCPTYSR